MGARDPSVSVGPSQALRRNSRGVDGPISSQNAGDGVLALRDLLDLLEIRPTKGNLDRLARKLGKIARGSPYSYRYLLSVWNGTTEPGQPLVAAIAILARASKRPTKEDMYGVTVWGFEIGVAGALVDSEARGCADEFCSNTFLPNTPARRYCYACRPRLRIPKEG